MGRTSHKRPARPRELRSSSGSALPEALAALQAARRFCPLTQGIGLRPQPWATLSRPVGPVWQALERWTCPTAPWTPAVGGRLSAWHLVPAPRPRAPAAGARPDSRRLPLTCVRLLFAADVVDSGIGDLLPVRGRTKCLAPRPAARPHVVPQDLTDTYRKMAANEARESEADERAEAASGGFGLPL